MTSDELSAITAEAEGVVRRHVEWLTRCGAVATAPVGDEATGLLLSGLAMRLLSARAVTPASRFARHGGVTVLDGDHDAAALRHGAHTRGVNRTLARLASDARRGGGRLAAWWNEPRSTRRFRHDGRWWFIRPDGSGVLAIGGERTPFLFEYDRGTLDAGDYRGKFEGYRKYFEDRVWERDFETRPVVLFVCADDRAEERVADAARSEGHRLRLLITSEWRFAPGSGHPAGLMGPIWRGVAEDGARVRLLGMELEEVGG